MARLTLEQQAEWAVLAYKRAQTEWPYVGVVNFWFFKPASDANANQASYYFRMLEPDFSPLPVYDAVKDYANRPPRMYPGAHQEDHWAVTWQGEWREAVDGAAMLGRYRVAGENAAARVCVSGGKLKVVRAPGTDQQARITVEKAEDGCMTLHAAPGAAIDGFVVRREPSRLIQWMLVMLAGSVAAARGWRLWRQRMGNG